MLFGYGKKREKSNPYIHTLVTHFWKHGYKQKTYFPPKKTWQGENRKNQSSFQPYMSWYVTDFKKKFPQCFGYFPVWRQQCWCWNELSSLAMFALVQLSPLFSWWLSLVPQTLQHFCCRGAALSVGATCIVWTLLLGELSSSGLSRICFCETIL